ncbi:MAG: DUF1116 domain-containing protein [Steroidobacteraceae bacterium]
MIDYAKPFAGALWFDVRSRAAVCPELSAFILLHAGPPYRGAPPAPVLNSAVQALLFEGLAADSQAARELLQDGRVQLRPAQDYGIVTPLAQVVCSSMLLLAVKQRGEVAYAPMVEGPPPALRFGSDAAQCRERLRAGNVLASSAIAPVIQREPIAIDELIRDAIAAGEECHARTSAANAALIGRMRGLDAESAARLRGNPAFVLPILMAAAAAALRSSDCAVTAIGGNGIDFGIRRRGQQAWQHRPAQAPRGPRFAGLSAQTALGAIGDSAVIDFCGLGGQALAAAPTLAAEWATVLPADALSRRDGLIDAHSGIVDPERIVRSAVAPIINLAVLDHEGKAGLIGRGCYCPPVSLFASP